MHFNFDTPFMEAFDKLDKLSEGAHAPEDPYGYGPYKLPTDPTLQVGDYIKAKRYSSEDKWYPARVTRITPDFVDYTISGFGFIKNGTVVKSDKAKRAFGNLRKQLLGEAANDPFAEFNLSASVEEALANYPYDFEIEYDGFVDTWDEDRFDPNSWYGHYTVAKSREVDPHTYSLPVENVLEDLMLIIPRNLKNPNAIEQAIKHRKEAHLSASSAKTEEAESRKLIADYQKLKALCEQVDGKAYHDDDHERLRIFVADHLDHFFALFYPEFEENYRDHAIESLW